MRYVLALLLAISAAAQDRRLLIVSIDGLDHRYLKDLDAMKLRIPNLRGLIQQGLDTGYEDFLRQQAYPREQLAFYSAMLQGTPVQPGTTTATYGQQPSFGQQLLGSGIAGLGLYNAFKGAGG